MSNISHIKRPSHAWVESPPENPLFPAMNRSRKSRLLGKKRLTSSKVWDRFTESRLSYILG